MSNGNVHITFGIAVLAGMLCCSIAGQALAQDISRVIKTPLIACSPEPCVLPPTQASEGGAEVANAPIVSDLLNPEHLLLGSNDANCQFDLSAYISVNSGSSWNLTCFVEGIGLYSPAGPPLIGYDRNQTAYFASVYRHFGYQQELVGIQWSSDGINWSRPVTALKQLTQPAYPWLAIDTNVTSPYVNTIYISAVAETSSAAQLYVSHSADGGNSWQQVAVAPPQTGQEQDTYTNITVGGDGTVYLVWVYCVSNATSYCGNDRAFVVLSASRDGGNTWSKPVPISELTIIPGMDLLPNTNIGMPFYPVIGVDNSSSHYAGNLYAAMWTWTGTYMRVQVVHSADGGTTWSKPVPVAPPSANHDQFFPWLSVSPTGLVGVTWLDRRNDPNNVDYQAFATISTDGGQSFRANIQLTTMFSNPNNNGYPAGLWMGNYTGNSWAGSNYFIAAWMDSSNGVDMQDVVGGIRLH